MNPLFKQPVFVDPTGRRGRGLRRIGVVIAAPVSAYLALMISSVLGGPTIHTPLLPLPAAAGGNAVSPVAQPQPPHPPVHGLGGRTDTAPRLPLPATDVVANWPGGSKPPPVDKAGVPGSEQAAGSAAPTVGGQTPAAKPWTSGPTGTQPSAAAKPSTAPKPSTAAKPSTETKPSTATQPSTVNEPAAPTADPPVDPPATPDGPAPSVPAEPGVTPPPGQPVKPVKSPKPVKPAKTVSSVAPTVADPVVEVVEGAGGPLGLGK